jgi:aquaporin Z
MALAFGLGPISGCHVNPAVTMGVWLAGRMTIVEAAQYWAAQFVGGIVGALVLWGTFSSSPIYSRQVTGLGTDGWGTASHLDIGAGGAFVTEVILTALFVFVILAVTKDSSNALVCPIAIGFALATVHLIGITIDGTSVNPARSLGPALVVGGTALRQVWLFIVAPLVGGAAAAGIYLGFYGRAPSTTSPEPAEA